MKRILESFKNLYKGQNVVKTHLVLAAMFIIPSLFGATIQFLDDDYKKYMALIAAISVLLGILSIVPIILLGGYWLKFIRKRLTEPDGLPEFDIDCLIQGFKSIPVGLVWTLYIAVPITFVLLISVAAFFAIVGVSGRPDPISIIIGMLGFCLLCFLLFIPLFIISPFIQQVYIKYADNGFKYSGEIFNPLTPFRYMKKAFKDTMITALKFLVVSLVTSSAAQFVSFIFILLTFAITMISVLTFGETLPLFVILIVICISSISGVISGYVSMMTNYAYIDNLEDVYKEKLKDPDNNSQNQE